MTPDVARRLVKKLLLLLPTACAVLCTTAAAAPPDVARMKARVAGLIAGTFPARACHGVDGESPETGVLTIAADGRIAAPSVALSMFDPAAEFIVERYVDGDPRTLTVHAAVYAGGQTFTLERAVPGDSPGFMEAGSGAPNANIVRGTECAEVDFAAARIAAPSFDMAATLVPLFATDAPVRGTCRSLAHGRSPSRPVQFTLDARGVVVDGVTLPFSGAGAALTRTSIGARVADGAFGGGFHWADGSSFHAERFVGGGFSTFSFTIAGKPDADKMVCRPG